MLLINVISIAVGILLFALSAYVFDNVTALIVSVVFVIMLNSVLAEIAVSRILHICLVREFIMEAAMTAAFILCVRLLPRWWACLAYFCVLAIYLCMHYKSISAIFKRKREDNAETQCVADAEIEQATKEEEK